MSLVEIKVEIPADAADAADGALLEHGDGGWSLLQDAIALVRKSITDFPLQYKNFRD